MVLFLLIGSVPVILALTLVGLVYLAWVELRGEDLDQQVKLWWVLLVLLTHVPGYLALRIWIAVRRRRHAERRPA